MDLSKALSLFASMHDTPRVYAEMPKSVHQIWIGPAKNMSVGIKRCIDSVKEWRKEIGASYRLYTWEDLKGEFSEDPCTDVFSKAMEVYPCVRLYVMISDYYRWAITAKHGGLYLDTDFETRRNPKVPVADLVFVTPHRDGSPGNGMIWCGEHGREASEICRTLASFEIRSALSDCDNFEDKLKGYLSKNIAVECIGPVMMNHVMLPAIERLGYTWKIASRKEVACWYKKAAFYHLGAAAWHSDESLQRTSDKA